MATLGERIKALINAQKALLKAAPTAQKGQIRARIEALTEQLEDVIDGAWSKNEARYLEALDQLDAASEAIETAKDDLAEVDGALEIVDEAISVVSKLVAAVAV